VAHPQVLPCRLKEPQFFSRGPAYVDAHIAEYWALFPERDGQEDVRFVWPELNAEGILYHEEVVTPRQPGLPYFTGEASANTFHEVAPDLVHRHLPDMKLIVLLREPVARVFSHHRMYVRFRDEGRELGLEITDFATDMARELARVRAGAESELISPGCYVENLRRWRACYPPEQLLVLFAEDLEARPQAVMDQVLAYLGYPPHDYGDYLQKRFNQAPPARPDAATAAALQAFYAPHNAALAHYLGRKLPW